MMQTRGRAVGLCAQVASDFCHDPYIPDLLEDQIPAAKLEPVSGLWVMLRRCGGSPSLQTMIYPSLAIVQGAGCPLAHAPGAGHRPVLTGAV